MLIDYLHYRKDDQGEKNKKVNELPADWGGGLGA